MSRPWRGDSQQTSRNEALTVAASDSSLRLLTVEAAGPVPQHVVVAGVNCIPRFNNCERGALANPAFAWDVLKRPAL